MSSVVCKCVGGVCIAFKKGCNSFSVLEFNAMHIVLLTTRAIDTVLKGTGVYLPLLKLRYFMNSPRTSSKLFLFLLFVSHTCTHMQIHTQTKNAKEKPKKVLNIKKVESQIMRLPRAHISLSKQHTCKLKPNTSTNYLYSLGCQHFLDFD